MSTLQATLAVIGGLFMLAGIAGTLYAFARGSANEARIKRLQAERDDYLSRLNYIEPRYDVLKEQNKTLRTLTDPTPRLERLADTIDDRSTEVLEELRKQSTNSDAIKGVLLSQARTLDEIRQSVHVDGRAGPGK